jgi:hypothetical protein
MTDPCAWCDDTATTPAGEGVAPTCDRHEFLGPDDAVRCSHPAKALDDWCPERVVATDGERAWCDNHQTPASYPVMATGPYVTADDVESATATHQEIVDWARGVDTSTVRPSPAGVFAFRVVLIVAAIVVGVVIWRFW